MSKSQEDYFSIRGGDAYFRRNLAKQEIARPNHPAVELLTATVGKDLSPKGRAAVVGGAGGSEAAGLEARLPGWTVLNIDISSQAIDFGRRVFPRLQHLCLSVTSERFVDLVGPVNLVMLANVLAWVDRSNLSRAIAHVDASLADGGFLLITSFAPPTRRKIAISHSPQHYTYKQDYSQAFLSLGIYEEVAMNSYTPPGPPSVAASERRISHQLLRKDLANQYPLAALD